MTEFKFLDVWKILTFLVLLQIKGQPCQKQIYTKPLMPLSWNSITTVVDMLKKWIPCNTGLCEGKNKSVKGSWIIWNKCELLIYWKAIQSLDMLCVWSNSFTFSKKNSLQKIIDFIIWELLKVNLWKDSWIVWKKYMYMYQVLIYWKPMQRSDNVVLVCSNNSIGMKTIASLQEIVRREKCQ